MTLKLLQYDIYYNLLYALAHHTKCEKVCVKKKKILYRILISLILPLLRCFGFSIWSFFESYNVNNV